jgi:hypothetical protein
MPRLSTNDWKGLWAVLWRVLVLCPILWIVGTALLLVVMAALVVPPFYVAFTIITGDWLFAGAALLGWFVVLRFRSSLLRWTLQGIKYGSL